MDSLTKIEEEPAEPPSSEVNAKSKIKEEPHPEEERLFTMDVGHRLKCATQNVQQSNRSIVQPSSNTLEVKYEDEGPFSEVLVHEFKTSIARPPSPERCARIEVSVHRFIQDQVQASTAQKSSNMLEVKYEDEGPFSEVVVHKFKTSIALPPSPERCARIEVSVHQFTQDHVQASTARETSNTLEVKYEDKGPFSEVLVHEFKTSIAGPPSPKRCARIEDPVHQFTQDQVQASTAQPSTENQGTSSADHCSQDEKHLLSVPVLKIRRIDEELQRLYMKKGSGDSRVNFMSLSSELLGRITRSYNEKDHPESESQKKEITKTPTVEQCKSKQYNSSSDKGNCSRSLNPNQKKRRYKDKKPLTCNICKKSFMNMSNLQRHESVHGNKSLHQCQMCDESFTKISDLKKHSKIHKTKKFHQCTICDKRFDRPVHLKTHIMVHEGKKPYHCNTCGKKFTYLSSLKTHKLIHDSNKSHHCKTCNHNFVQLSNLKIHELIHEGIKPYECETCHKKFSQGSGLKKHQSIHEGKKPYQCDICKKCFTELSYMRVHIMIHEGKKPHKCQKCDKSFTDISALRRHVLTHDGKKPHLCSTCKKSFTTKSNLKVHSLIHEGKKPFQCNLCNKSFTQLATMKKHKLVHKRKK